MVFLVIATAASRSVVSVQAIGDLRLGDRVIVTSSQGSKAGKLVHSIAPYYYTLAAINLPYVTLSRLGTLRYLGEAEFAAGQWAGVELDDPLGKNDGAVAGTRYFDCMNHYGLFAPVHKVSRSPANQMRRSSGIASSITSSHNRSMGRQNTRESIGGGSSAASVASSAAVSRASTAVSRVRASPNPRLGVTSLTNSPSHQLNRQVAH